MPFGLVERFQNFGTWPINPTSWSISNDSDSCSGGAEISAGIWATLTDVFHGFPQSLHTNVGQ
jgi:hypothetical protein